MFGIGAVGWKQQGCRCIQCQVEVLPGCGIVIELEFDEFRPSRFRFESTCIIRNGLGSFKSSAEWPMLKSMFKLLFVRMPLVLYCGL